MPCEVAPLVQQTINALSVLDADRLEELQQQISARSHDSDVVQSAVKISALNSTLLEVLRTTHANLRLLRHLHELDRETNGVGIGRSTEATGVPRWVR